MNSGSPELLLGNFESVGSAQLHSVRGCTHVVDGVSAEPCGDITTTPVGSTGKFVTSKGGTDDPDAFSSFEFFIVPKRTARTIIEIRTVAPIMAMIHLVFLIFYVSSHLHQETPQHQISSTTPSAGSGSGCGQYPR